MHEPRVVFGPDLLFSPRIWRIVSHNTSLASCCHGALPIACRITCTRFNSGTLIRTVSSLTARPSQ